MKIPLSPPNLQAVLSKPGLDLVEMLKQGPLYKGQYLHWDQLRHRAPPAQLTLETWWAGIKISRQALSAS